jgi:hypothetical protein
MTGLVVWTGIVLAAVLVFYVIIARKLTRGGFGPAFLTTFHDWQPADKQEAIEITMDEMAGKKRAEQESGLDVDQGSMRGDTVHHELH